MTGQVDAEWDLLWIVYQLIFLRSLCYVTPLSKADSLEQYQHLNSHFFRALII